MIDYTKFEIELNKKLATLTAELEIIAKHNQATDDWEAVPDTAELNEADINNEADAVEEWNERRATVASLETEYRDVKRALAKIAAGTYGICEISGQAIEAERLAIKPTARTCQAHLNDEATLPW